MSITVYYDMHTHMYMSNMICIHTCIYLLRLLRYTYVHMYMSVSYEYTQSCICLLRYDKYTHVYVCYRMHTQSHEYVRIWATCNWVASLQSILDWFLEMSEDKIVAEFRIVCTAKTQLLFCGHFLYLFRVPSTNCITIQSSPRCIVSCLSFISNFPMRQW